MDKPENKVVDLKLHDILKYSQCQKTKEITEKSAKNSD